MASSEAMVLDALLAQRQHLWCIVVGSLAVVVWDILLHLQVDFQLMRKSGFHLPQAVYVASRIMAIAFVLSEMIFLSMFIELTSKLRS
ncbi:hypothetical protein AAF712_003727 [Marasmius tenuissimus]|uniref:DUF6533 domain-containing protein n=1 Tax=Marasmius tenuissimus TaxID=585030 RepID=A0ABR3A6U2_9AGAR